MDNNNDSRKEHSSQQINIADKIKAEVNNFSLCAAPNKITYADLDHVAIHSEWMFFKRFGFITNLAGRKNIIAIQRKNDLTSLQISNLYLSGHINIKKNGAVNKNTFKFSFIYGKGIIGYLVLTGLLQIALTILSDMPYEKVNLLMLIITFVYLAFILLANFVYIYPYKLANELIYE